MSGAANGPVSGLPAGPALPDVGEVLDEAFGARRD